MTIREIAEMAGVSNAAVSRYLNNGYLSDEKREKIKKVIEETGYSPSHNARTLRTKRTKLIGVALPKIDSETISKIVAGIGMELSKYGYYLILANTDNTVKKEYEYIRVFKNNLVDGMIIIGTMMDKTHKKLIKSLDCPAVVVGQQVDYCQCVYHDDFEAARQLTELMIEAGRRNIGYIGAPKTDVAAGLRRFEGYSAALKKHGLKPMALSPPNPVISRRPNCSRRAPTPTEYSARPTISRSAPTNISNRQAERSAMTYP